jgi:6,7-dimethyl-8-ribityllumazine synthase
MTEDERRRMPRDTPEWTGEAPEEDPWPRRPEVERREDAPARAADELAEDPFAERLPTGEEEDDQDTDAPVAAVTEDEEEAEVEDEAEVEEQPEEEVEEPEDEPEDEPELPPAPDEQLEAEEQPEDEAALAERAAADHAAGEIDIPDGYDVIEGYPAGHRRRVALVVSRFNGEVTNRMLARALAELREAGVDPESVTVMPVPGAFELPLGAMALAKTRRYSCIVALGCVIRGETPHFDYVAGEAASGIQLAAIETGVPVAFGVLPCETRAQADARIDKGAEAVRTALEMADVFSQVRASARA